MFPAQVGNTKNKQNLSRKKLWYFHVSVLSITFIKIYVWSVRVGHSPLLGQLLVYDLTRLQTYVLDVSIMPPGWWASDTIYIIGFWCNSASKCDSASGDMLQAWKKSFKRRPNKDCMLLVPKPRTCECSIWLARMTELYLVEGSHETEGRDVILPLDATRVFWTDVLGFIWG